MKWVFESLKKVQYTGVWAVVSIAPFPQSHNLSSIDTDIKHVSTSVYMSDMNWFFKERRKYQNS